MIRAQEETGRGDDPRDSGQVLSDKLYWTFQTDKLGDLVQKAAANTIFLQPKEFLSLAKVILKSALQDKSFGFDAFKRSRQTLEDMFQGKIEYQTDAEKWVYRQGTAQTST